MTLELRLTPVALAELATKANAEHRLVVSAQTEAVRHAICAGEALNEAKAHLPRGDWMPWLAENFEGSRTRSSQYRRLALSKDAVLAGRFTSVRGAERYLVETGLIGEMPQRSADMKRRIDEARRLRDKGLAAAEIADVMQVNVSSIYMWLRPDRKRVVAQRNSRSRQARLALQRQARDAAARKAGGNVAEAYNVVLKLSRILNAIHDASTEPEFRAAISSALHRTYLVRDEIVKGLGILNGDASGLYAASRYQGRIAAATLTPAQLQEIRSAYAAGGVSQEALGRRYRVSPSTISKAVHGLVDSTARAA